MQAKLGKASATYQQSLEPQSANGCVCVCQKTPASIKPEPKLGRIDALQRCGAVKAYQQMRVLAAADQATSGPLPLVTPTNKKEQKATGL